MKRLFYKIWFAICLCFAFGVIGMSATAYADECMVTSQSNSGEGSLRWAVEKAVSGGCVTDDANYRDLYQPFYPGAIRFHVVRFTGSIDIYLEEPIEIGSGVDSDPIVLIADESASVRIRGDSSGGDMGILIEGDKVILDHLTVQSFAGTGLIIEGNDSLVIRSRVSSNSEDGMKILGMRNQIVDTEVLANGFNGIVVGKSDIETACGFDSSQSLEGQETEIIAVSVHDNGSNVLGSDCSESIDAAAGACNAIRMEAENCYATVNLETTCEESGENGASDECKSLQEEKERCQKLFSDVGITENSSIEDAVTAVYKMFSGANGGFGIFVNADDVSFRGIKPESGAPVLYGLQEPLNLGRYSGSVRDNKSYGVFVNSHTNAWLCRDIKEPADLKKLNGTKITETTFGGNASKIGVSIDNGIMSSGPMLPRLAHVAAVGDERTGEYVVTGSVLSKGSRYNPYTEININPLTVRVEVYLSSNEKNEGLYFLAAQDGIESVSGSFTIHLPNPITIDGAPVPNPAFVAIYIDTERGVSSPFSMVSGTTAGDDSDGDGLADSKEDIDGDGIVGPGESDPANPDTDGDGLTDGEERESTGRIARLIAEGVVFENLSVLDPANPDSDGDCIPDGAEVGVTEGEALTMIEMMRSRPHYKLSPSCRAKLEDKAILKLENAIPYDPSQSFTLDNISVIYDEDPDSVTDPTSGDTDRDGLTDSEEDWNMSGRREGNKIKMADIDPDISKAYNYSKPTAGEVLDTCSGDGEGWTETDPNMRDSDGDGLIDGEEGAVTIGDVVLDKNESSPLLCDTDGDGVPDGMEKRVGTFVNLCDTDQDGLADGIELGIIHPTSVNPACRGLQAAGTNMKLPNMLDPKNPDSDGDGLEDGVEDINQNGWVDGTESDPTLSDTDYDGVEDGVEFTGDFDGDGVPDFDMRLISNGRDCNPPKEIFDLDCDGIPNARDEDSDNDGCPDSGEGGWVDNDGNGIADMYDADSIACNSGGGGGGGGSALPSVSGGDEEEENSFYNVPEWALDQTGGGACTFVPSLGVIYYNQFFILIFLPILIFFALRLIPNPIKSRGRFLRSN